MDKTLQQMLVLAREGNIEHRCAALLVLGALRLDDQKVLDTVRTALEHENVILKDYALRYCEEGRPKGSIPLLIPLLENTDRNLRERVIRLLTEFGQSTVRPLLQFTKTSGRIGRNESARVLCAIRGKSAWQTLMQMLLFGDSEVNKTICDLVAPVLRELEEKEQEVLYNEVDNLAQALDEQEQRPTVIAAIRLLGLLGRPQARKWLIKFVDPVQPHVIRFHALVALLHCLRGQELHKSELARLLPLLEEPEFSDTVRLTLDLLDAHELTADYQPILGRLLESPHVAVQKFALRKMGEFDSPTVVRTLVQELGDSDVARRDAAARSLRKIPAARSALVKEFLVTEDPSKAWAIAGILPTYDGKWRHEMLTEVWNRLRKAIEEEERIQGAYIHFLKNIDADFVYEQFAAQGAKLKKARKYREAIRFLAPLKEFPHFAPEEKFALAISQLKLHTHDVVSAPSRHDPVLLLFAELYRASAFPVVEMLKKEKALTPEELFYLGFCFIEGAASERNLGEDLLVFLADKYSRTKVGKNAKNKLKLLAA